ncbi:MAG: nucleotidyltransferase [Acidimicrobiales bacterium]|nr:nucleotidyltransferase [Acidimicrobiales bacterium]
MQQNDLEGDGGAQVPLVVLAAGAGSRFGGEKPLAVVGPAGESLLDYTIFDAMRIGFDPVVLIVSDRNHRAIETHLAERHDVQRLRYAVQGHGSALPQRPKPWGTVDAVLSASRLLTGAFAVANADDFYGYDALRSLADALNIGSGRGEDVDHLVTYPWRSTMPPSGTANRGVCTVDPDGRLVGIDERRDLTSTSPLDADDQVSMNLWGFGPSAVDLLSRSLEEFFRSHGSDPNAELTIPDAMSHLVRVGRTVLVHSTGRRWIGVTYPDDVEWARERIAELLSEGAYPARLAVSR